MPESKPTVGELITKYWSQIVQAVALIAWLAVLEHRVTNIEEAFKPLTEKVDRLALAVERLDATLEAQK